MIATPEWQVAPNILRLDGRQIDIWLIKLGNTPCQPDYLNSFEQMRLAEFKNTDARQQYCASHTALHLILGRYLDTPPQNVQLEILEGGKPQLSTHPPPLHFNLSHAQKHALLAVCLDREVGIDIEINHPLPPNRMRIAERIFQAGEIEQFRLSNENSETFYRLWSRMEARQKCLGRGVFGIPTTPDEVQTLSFTPAPGQIAAIAWPVGYTPDEFNFYLELQGG